MKNNRIFAAFAAFACAFSLFSCKQEEIQPYTADGMPVRSVSLLATSPEEKIEVTRASAAVESNIDNLALVLIPKANGKAKVFKGDELSFSQTSKPSETNVFYSLSISEDALVAADIRGGQYYLYAIANYNKKFVEMDIDAIEGKTKAEIDSLVLSKGTNDIDLAESSILMTGKYCEGSSVDGLVTLYGDNPATNTDGKNTLTGTIHLRRIVSKVQFDVTTGDGITFKPKYYHICNYARSTTMMERLGWDGSDPGSLKYAGNGSFSTPKPFTANSSTFVFYMPENVQVAKNHSENYNGRESHTTLEPDQAFANAPDNGTYVIITGDYSDANFAGEVTYTIHLGDFGRSVDNYSVRRNFYYKYRVNVQGVSKIVAECETDNLGPEDEPQPGAEGNLVNKNGRVNATFTLDSHYEQIMISFPSATIREYSLLVNTPYTGGDKLDHDHNADLTDDCTWIRFGCPAAIDKFSSYKESNTCDIYTLIDELQGKTTASHFLTSGDGFTYVEAFVEEYFYEGKPVESFVGAKDRVLTLFSSGIKYSQDKHSSVIGDALFSIKQKSIKTAMSLSVDNPFGIESIDESTPKSTFDSGKDPGVGTTINGWNNFSAILAKAGVAYGSSQWGTYVNVIKNGHFTGETSAIADDMVSPYDYGFYQCLSRNRDENANGKIDEDEIKWYLPSYDQYCILFLGETTLDSDAHLYPAQAGASDQYFTSNNGVQRMYFANEGFASNKYREVANWIDVTRAHVRCARSLKNQKNPTTDVATQKDGLVVVSGLDEAAIRNTYVEDEYGQGSQRDPSNSMTYVFQPAPQDLSTTYTLTKDEDLQDVIGGNVCENNPELVGEGWRVPSMKEFYLMLKTGVVSSGTPYVFRTLLDDPRDAASGTIRYNGYDGNHIYSFTAKDSPLRNAHIRCVRDISNDAGDIAVSDRKLNASKTETAKTFQVFSRNGVEWTVTSSDPEVTVSPTSGIGNTTITVSLPEAIKGGRKVKLLVTPTNIEHEPLEVKLTQETADLDLDVSTEEITVDASATSASFDVIADPQVEWAVSTTTGVTGFTIGKTSGSGNATINLTFDPVTTGRKIVITVSSRTEGVVSKYHTITFRQGVQRIEKTYTWTLAKNDIKTSTTSLVKYGMTWDIDRPSSTRYDYDNVDAEGVNIYCYYSGNTYTLSSSSFPGTIKSISVDTRLYTDNKPASLTLKVDATEYLSSASLSKSSKTYVGTGDSSGRVMIVYKADAVIDFWLKSITVVYEVEQY